MARALGRIAIAAAVAASCATPSEGPRASATPQASDVLDSYRLYATGDCAAVRARARDIDATAPAPGRESLRLLEAHCRELEGDTDGATDLYAAIASSSGGGFYGYQAASRLQQLERMESRGLSREELALRVAEPDPSSAAPRPRHRMHPTYPPVLRGAGIEGWIVVQFEVSRDGAVIDPIVLDSDPPFVFEGAALAVIRNWIYEPTESAEPIPARVRLNFEIDEGGAVPPRERPPEGS